MITDDRICRALYIGWICELRDKKDPDYDAKVKIIKDVMDVLGVEGLENFDQMVEDYWNRHYLHNTFDVWHQ